MHLQPARVDRAYLVKLSNDPLAQHGLQPLVPPPVPIAQPQEELVRISGFSKRGRRCSQVTPDGPGATPFLADLKFWRNLCSSMSNWAQQMTRNGFSRAGWSSYRVLQLLQCSIHPRRQLCCFQGRSTCRQLTHLHETESLGHSAILNIV